MGAINLLNEVEGLDRHHEAKDFTLVNRLHGINGGNGHHGIDELTGNDGIHGLHEVNGANGHNRIREACDANEHNSTDGANSTHGTHGAHGSDDVHGLADLYELLQISPYAGPETIHRIYRFLAARYHPDNPATGNSDMFHKVKTAYDVLSHPERRAKYDAARSGEIKITSPLSSTIDFMDDIEGEINRRLALLAVLYARRRTSPRFPQVTLMEIETYMGFPRDYLDFTTWYLVKKGYVHQADNSDFTLTVAGVDYVETQRANLPILNRMLTNGRIRSESEEGERRLNGIDRRMDLPDERAIKTERRMSKKDRRKNRTDIRKLNPGSTAAN